MKAFYKLPEPGPKQSFKVDYPYYGLFGTADVSQVEEGKLFECKLRNGKTVVLKKIQKKWVDITLNEETPLSQVIGTSIEEFLKN